MEAYSKTNTFSDESDYLLKYSTPLIFINNGISEKNGIISDFELKNIILKKIGIETESLFKNPEGKKIRPLSFDIKARQFYYDVDKKESFICNNINDHEFCEESHNWEENMKVLYNDILFGKQYINEYIK